MNDRCLYRAKRMDNGEWVEGFYFTDNKRHYIITKIIDDNNAIYGHMAAFEVFVVNPSTICQCTGLRDRNGKLIWENDILGFLDVLQYDNGYSEHYCIGRVIWDEETISFQVTERLFCESYEVLDGDCEVVGNIFDNPELLEEGAE